MDNNTCTIDGCANVKAKRNDKCWDHHIAALRERFGVTPIPKRGSWEYLVKRFWENVEQGHGCWEWFGGTIKGHGRLSFNGKTIYAHRVSWEIANGPIPEGMEIDHMCHNRACQNPEHLRLVTDKQNNENRYGANPNNKLGVHGVHWRKDVGKYQVTIKHHNKTLHVGYFTDLTEAGEAARLKRNELFTHNDKDRRAA